MYKFGEALGFSTPAGMRRLSKMSVSSSPSKRMGSILWYLNRVLIGPTGPIMVGKWTNRIWGPEKERDIGFIFEGSLIL